MPIQNALTLRHHRKHNLLARPNRQRQSRRTRVGRIPKQKGRRTTGIPKMARRRLYFVGVTRQTRFLKIDCVELCWADRSPNLRRQRIAQRLIKLRQSRKLHRQTAFLVGRSRHGNHLIIGNLIRRLRKLFIRLQIIDRRKHARKRRDTVGQPFVCLDAKTYFFRNFLPFVARCLVRIPHFRELFRIHIEFIFFDLGHVHRVQICTIHNRGQLTIIRIYLLQKPRRIVRPDTAVKNAFAEYRRHNFPHLVPQVDFFHKRRRLIKLLANVLAVVRFRIVHLRRNRINPHRH